MTTLKYKLSASLTVLALAVSAGAATAADLTPTGAEKAGNADGSIPAWDGGLTKPPAGWSADKGYTDPFASEKPLFTINAKNLDTYKDKVTPGLAALLKKYPDLSAPVYPTHRTLALPEKVYENTKALAGKTSVDGLTLKGYTMPAIPFPVPKNGVEEMYNHNTRYEGGGYNRCGDWLPVRASGDFYRVGFCEDKVFDSNMDAQVPNRLFTFYGYYDAPATLVGTIYLVNDVIDKTVGDRQAWIYNAGQRRTRRAPDLAYDNIDDGTEGMRFTDEFWGFNGALDRYDWKLVGKKEMYIPYNAYKLSDTKLKYKDMVAKGSLKPELMRYELHRVWVVDATLKKGMSHAYSRRTFYIDEDSHIIAASESYDSRGNLWRVNLNPLIQLYDVPLMIQRAYLVHDLSNGSYIVSELDNERKQPAMKFGTTGKAADFTVDAFRRRGTR